MKKFKITFEVKEGEVIKFKYGIEAYSMLTETKYRVKELMVIGDDMFNPIKKEIIEKKENNNGNNN